MVGSNDLNSVVADLQYRFDSIEMAEHADGDETAMALSTRVLQANIMARVAGFLRDHADFAPSRETFLAAVEKAIDLAFTTLNRPFLASLLKPVVKAQVLAAAGALYDSIFTPAIEV
jgi:hypothetical protein